MEIGAKLKQEFRKTIRKKGFWSLSGHLMILQKDSFPALTETEIEQKRLIFQTPALQSSIRVVIGAKSNESWRRMVESCQAKWKSWVRYLFLVSPGFVLGRPVAREKLKPYWIRQKTSKLWFRQGWLLLVPSRIISVTIWHCDPACASLCFEPLIVGTEWKLNW